MSYEFLDRPLALSLRAALRDDAFYRALEESVAGPIDRRREALCRYLDYSIREARSIGALYTVGDPAHGASVWAEPLATEAADQAATRKLEFIADQLGPASLAAYRSMTADMGERRRGLLPSACRYLSIIGVDPGLQNRGLGTGLIQPGLEVADRCGDHVYLETFSARNQRFYQRHGFESLFSAYLPGASSRYTLMVRKPTVGSGA